MIKINKDGCVEIEKSDIEKIATELAMGIAAILEHYPKIKIAHGVIMGIANELPKNEVLRIVDVCYKCLDEAEQMITGGAQ